MSGVDDSMFEKYMFQKGNIEVEDICGSSGKQTNSSRINDGSLCRPI